MKKEFDYLNTNIEKIKDQNKKLNSLNQTLITEQENI